MLEEIEASTEKFPEHDCDFNDVDAYYIGGLTYYQMGMIFFKIFCILANVLIVYNICKNKLSTTTYLTVVNWSILNILLLLTYLPDELIPEEHLPFAYYFITTCIGYSLLPSIGMLATLLSFDRFIKSEKFCKISVRTIWCFLSLLCLLSVIMIIFLDIDTLYFIYQNNLIELNCFIPLFICIAMFLISMFYWKWCSKEGSFYLRIKLSTIFILSLIFVSIAVLTVHLHGYYFLTSFLCTIVTNLNGFINLIVLTSADLEFRKCFQQLFSKSKINNDINSNTNNFEIKVVLT